MADKWPRLDPRTGLMLCQPCWNNGENWEYHCNLGFCECPKRGCNGYERPASRPRKAKHAELREKYGQAEIIADPPLRITARS